jgi:hypothetical protein
MAGEIRQTVNRQCDRRYGVCENSIRGHQLRHLVRPTIVLNLPALVAHPICRER